MKEEQKKLITEIMNEDSRDGLYKQQTAMQLLFAEFKALSKSSRDAGDIQSANLIDFLCEREQVAIDAERHQIEEAYKSAYVVGENIAEKVAEFRASDYYTEKFGG